MSCDTTFRTQHMSEGVDVVTQHMLEYVDGYNRLGMACRACLSSLACLVCLVRLACHVHLPYLACRKKGWSVQYVWWVSSGCTRHPNHLPAPRAGYTPAVLPSS